MSILQFIGSLWSKRRSGSVGIIAYIGIADMKVSNDPGEILVAANLGSCLGISMYDPRISLGGMVHCLLPSSTSDPRKAEEQPFMYVDSGIAYLLRTMLENGAQKKLLQVVAVGGSQMHDPNGVFQIGKKNFTVLRKQLWVNNLLLKAEHIGGEQSRTLSLNIGSGEVWVKTQGQSLQLI